MAISAVVTLNPAGPVPIATEIQAKITISNSGAAELAVSNAVPLIKPSAQASDAPTFSQNASKVAIPANSPVPASGSLVLTFPVVFNSGTGLSTNSIGCLLYMADGSLVSATPATISIVGNNQYA